MAKARDTANGDDRVGPTGSEPTEIAETVEPETVEPEIGGSTDVDAPLGPGVMVDSMRVMRLLGRGGMGEVYLARDMTLGRKVALKALRSSAGRVEHLLGEARALARCNHPHIVTIYNVGTYGGAPYLALEYLEGEELAKRIRRQPPTVGEALRYTAAIADALLAAHGAGVLHRDLKPGNVMLPDDGRLRVVDFGLARAIEAERRRRVRRGISGTPGYMAPEQWRGEACSPATDVWSLGVMLYLMVVGRLPFTGETVDDIAAATRGPTPAPPVESDGEPLPAGLAELVARCLEKAPDARPGVAEVAATVQRMLNPDLQLRDDEGPFRGLEPFTERHAAVFFGRDAEVTAACERLETAPVLLVLGPSGAGKSSFVRAGVVPRLRERWRWRVLTVRPGADPFAALARVLSASADGAAVTAADLSDHPRALGQQLRAMARRSGRRVLLVVDQLEEAFALATDAEAADDFVEAVCLAADDVGDPVRVVATLREAFMGRITERAAGRFALRHLMVLRRPSRSMLVDILERPLAATGYRFEDSAMVDQMVDAVDGSPARLPLLEFAAQRLWDQRDRAQRLLTRAGLDAMGGVEGVLARHADRVLDGFVDIRPVRALCLRLVTPDDTRRVVTRAQLLDGLPPAAAAALDRLIDARLVTARRVDGEVEVELTHESLITQWIRLRRWIEASRDERSALAEAEAAAQLWDRRGRRASELWDGAALADARRAIERVAEPPAIVQQFVTAGLDHARRRRAGRTAIWVLATSVLAVVAVVLAILTDRAEQARGDAQAQARDADRRRLDARSKARLARRQQAAAMRASARAAHIAGRPLEARARLRAAMELEDHPDSRALWQTLDDAPVRFRRHLGTFVHGAALNPAGDRVAVAGEDGILRIFDLRDGRETRPIAGPDSVLDVHWAAPDRLYAGLSERGLVMIDPDRGAVTPLPGGEGGMVSGVVESAAGDVVFTFVKTVRRCRLPCLEATAIATLPDRALDAVAAPAANRVIVHAGALDTYLLDLERGTTSTLEGDRVTVRRPVAFVDDDTMLVGNLPAEDTVSRLRLVDGVVAERAPLWDRMPFSRVRSMAYDPVRRRLLVGDTVGRVWLSESGGVPRRLGQTEGHVAFVGFTGPGAAVAIGAAGDLGVWRVPPPEGSGPEPVPVSGYRSLWVEPSGLAVTSSGDHLMTFARDGAVERVLALPAAAWGARLLPDSNRAMTWIGKLWFEQLPRRPALHRAHADPAAGSPTTPLFTALDEMWTLDGERRVGRQRLVDDRGVSLSRARITGVDGIRDRDAIVADDTRVGRWSVGRSAPRWLSSTDDAWISGAVFSPDGRWVAVSSYQPDALILDAETGAVEQRLPSGAANLQSVAATDEWVFASSSDGQIHQWRLSDGRHRSVMAHRRGADELAIDREAEALLSIGTDGLLRRWDFDLTPVWRTVAAVDDDEPGGPWLATHAGWSGADSSSPPWRDAPWARRVADAVSAAVDGETVCLVERDGAVVRFDRRAPQRAARFVTSMASGGRIWPAVWAADGSCLIRAGADIHAWASDQPAPVPVNLGDVEADDPPIVALPDGFALVRGEELVVLGLDGAVRERFAVPPGVTAVTRLADETWVLGFRGGRVAAHAPAGAAPPTPVDITALSSPVTALAEAPMDTLVVGHADGRAELWSISDRQRLRTSRLHGSITAIAGRGARITLASELGAHVTWTVDALLDDRCRLMQRVWREAPAVWRGSAPAIEPPPTGHVCASSTEFGAPAVGASSTGPR